MSAAQNEATRETTEFEFFDRKWTVPSKVLFVEREKLEARPTNVGICHAFLDADQLAALRKINPDDDALDKFTDEIAKAVGLVNSGNSSPSSASS